MSDLTWDEYCAEAVKTAPQQSAEMQIAQAALGLCDEVREAKVAHSASNLDASAEIGDCLWYMAIACDGLVDVYGYEQMYKGCNLRDPPWTWDASLDRGAPESWAASFAGRAESVCFQGADPEGEKTDLIGSLASLAVQLQAMTGTRMAQICRRNIAKLRDRHGSSWSPAEEQDR